jgi:PKD repeat protein
MNTGDVGCTTTGYNHWVINNAYAGGSGSLICAGFPFTFNVPATPAQPAAITGFPNSHYMHTISDASIASGITNCCFLASDGILCYFDENYFTRMSSDINTTGYDTVTLSFWWLCQGGNESFGEVYYSTNGGTSWILSPSIPKYNLTSNWTQTTFYDPAWLNQPTLRIGFRFVNQATTAANDPGFGIDEITITGIVANNLPVVNFVASDTAFCEESCIDFTDLSTNSPTSWQWLFPGAVPDTSTAQNPNMICYSAPGTYDVTLIATNASGSDTLTITNYITIYPNPPQPVITVTGGDTLCTDPGYIYQWYYNGSILIPGATDMCYVAIFPGSYTVQITDGQGCVALSDPIVISGISDNDFSQNFFEVFPNPASGEITLKCAVPGIATCHVIINNIIGKAVIEEDLNFSNGIAVQNIKNLTNGFYFLQIMTTEGTGNKKILVKN